MNTISLPLTWKDKDVEVDKDGVKTFPLDSSQMMKWLQARKLLKTGI